MARTTRSTKSSGTASREKPEPKASASRYQLDPRNQNPSKLYVLPKNMSKDAEVVILPDPRTARPSRYLICPDTGFFEFKKISSPKDTPRSWLIHTSKRGSVEQDTEVSGLIASNADLFIATAIDPLFLIIPTLFDPKSAKSSDERQGLFLLSDDYLDRMPQVSSHLFELLKSDKTRALIEARFAAVCDTVEAGDETMFRLNEQKLISVLVAKAKKMSENGLPATMEEKFVRKPLEAPMMVQKSEAGRNDKQQQNGSTVESTVESTVSTPLTESNDSQSTTQTQDSATSSESQASSAATSFAEETSEVKIAVKASADVIALQRLRVAFEFICSSYVAALLTSHLQQLLKDKKNGVDFTPLDDYLSEIAKIRSEALASRSLGDYSRKHGRDEEEDEARAEKKRKLEEEKRRKASETRGVRELKKVNTSGMMKLSAFFKKK
jgi:hypothetical protein